MLGYTLEETGEQASIVLPLYDNGDAVQYITKNPAADRPRLVYLFLLCIPAQY